MQPFPVYFQGSCLKFADGRNKNSKYLVLFTLQQVSTCSISRCDHSRFGFFFAHYTLSYPAFFLLLSQKLLHVFSLITNPSHARISKKTSHSMSGTKTSDDRRNKSCPWQIFYYFIILKLSGSQHFQKKIDLWPVL